jgi:hypothetical protein
VLHAGGGPLLLARKFVSSSSTSLMTHLCGRGATGIESSIWSFHVLLLYKINVQICLFVIY